VLLALAALATSPVAVAAQAPAAPPHQHAQPPPADGGPPAPPPSAEPLPPFIPAPTDAERQAAFPDVHGHAVHDRAVNFLVLFDQLEWQTGAGVQAVAWDNKTWIGKDRDRLWLRTEGEAGEDGVALGQAHVLYGRSISRWWDLVVGVQQDVRPGPSRTWAAFGVQGLAPYWFEVEATAHVGDAGRSHYRFETEYELRLSRRMAAQALVELEIHGKDDPERGIGAGLATGEAGLRVRYEVRREIAPYLGVVWTRKFFGTAEAARAQGESIATTRLAVGLRTWF
jgi:copper resistance protein B